jgi:hypothetical protein
VDLIVVIAGETKDRTLRTCPYGTPSERHDLVQMAVDGDVVAYDRRTGHIAESKRFLAEATPCRKKESFRAGAPSVEVVANRWDSGQVSTWASHLVAQGAGGSAVLMSEAGARIGGRVRPAPPKRTARCTPAVSPRSTATSATSTSTTARSTCRSTEGVGAHIEGRHAAVTRQPSPWRRISR